MQKTIKHHHYISIMGIALVTILGLLVLMTVTAKGQCAPLDLNCMNLP